MTAHEKAPTDTGRDLQQSTEEYRKGSLKDKRLEETLQKWVDAEKNYNRIKDLLSQADELRQQMRKQMRELHDNAEEVDEEYYSIKLRSRSGSIDKSALKKHYPRVNLDKVTKAGTSYWVHEIKWNKLV